MSDVARRQDKSDVASGGGMSSPESAPRPGTLRGNSLGLTGLVVLGTAYMGLALAAYFNFGIMEDLTGPVVPLAFVAVTVLMLPTAASYAIMNGRRPSAGSTFTWLWEATLPGFGIWLGWILVITYITGAALQPVMFGLFANSFLNVFNVHASAETAVVADLLAVLVVGYLTRRDVRLSARALGVFIVIEAGFVGLLSAYIVLKQGLAGHLAWQPLSPGRAMSWSGFLNALLFGVLSIAAFDIVAPVAEETRTPRSLVPRATILVTLGAGAYWVLTSFGIVTGTSPRVMAAYVSSGQFTPIYLVAEKYVGALKIMVPLTGFTASIAAMSAVSIAASRQLFALARERVAPGVFATTNSQRNPWNAQLLVLGCCMVLPILVTFYQNWDPLQAFAWIGQAYVFLILIPYTLTCVANIFYHLRYRRAEFNWLTNLALPVLGIVVNCYILYKDFFETLLLNTVNFRTETSVAVACFALVLAAVAVTMIGIRRAGGVAAVPYQRGQEAAGPPGDSRLRE
jgi:amino acid transporter